jgi:hypothetical protein
MRICKHFVILFLILMTGCAGVSKQDYLSEKRTIAVSQGATPAYADGFQDACDGVYDATFKKNLRRSSSDREYEKGWQDGRQHCQKEADQLHEYYQNTPVYYYETTEYYY